MVGIPTPVKLCLIQVSTIPQSCIALIWDGAEAIIALGSQTLFSTGLMRDEGVRGEGRVGTL